MATLTYNGVTLQILRTLDFSWRPVRSADDTDYLMSHVYIAVQAVFNPAATADSVQNGRGNRAGMSLSNLHPVLMKERRTLRYMIGPDVVIKAPEDDNAPCDCWNGPKPVHCRVTNLIGDKTAIVEYAIECWVSDYANLVLSNRWAMRESLSEDFFTTITYSGRASFRKDILNTLGLTQDQFRAALIPRPETGFKRRVLDVQITEDGRDMAYEVVDEQVFLSLGVDSPATRIEGNVTVGSDSPIRDVGTLLKKGKEAGETAATILIPFYGAYQAATFLQSILPTVRGSAIVRVWGRPEAPKSQLVRMAVAVALDRLDPFGGRIGFGVGRVYPVSAYLTQSIETNFVEFRMEAFSGAQALANGLLQPLKFEALMRLDVDIGVASGVTTDVLTFNAGLAPEPLNSFGSRGNYLRLLVTQFLGVAGQFPPPPLSPVAGADQNLR